MFDLKASTYLQTHSSNESQLLAKLRRETELKCLNPIMLSGEFQGNFLSIISKIKKPKNVLEIGTYTGYSTICIAEGLDKKGTIHTIDKNEELIEIQNKYFELSNYRNQIKQYTGEALKIIPSMKLNFDLIFLDADKENYSNYLKKVSPLLNKGGILISDNVLWHGKVLDENRNYDKTTKLIDEFNKNIIKDKTLQSIMLPLRDGISVSVKL
jgi:predicted O-methyltransferase YrrM|tara:strand:- start:323 stop:958 length:636 start_codon:yes stop_codon:yes gene_type:complete